MHTQGTVRTAFSKRRSKSRERKLVLATPQVPGEDDKEKKLASRKALFPWRREREREKRSFQMKVKWKESEFGLNICDGMEESGVEIFGVGWE